MKPPRGARTHACSVPTHGDARWLQADPTLIHRDWKRLRTGLHARAQRAPSAPLGRLPSDKL